jgi:hypothetical protein
MLYSFRLPHTSCGLRSPQTQPEFLPYSILLAGSPGNVHGRTCPQGVSQRQSRCYDRSGLPYAVGQKLVHKTGTGGAAKSAIKGGTHRERWIIIPSHLLRMAAVAVTLNWFSS